MTWYPIETAPKDGTAIIVFGHSKQFKIKNPNVADSAMVGWWDKDRWVVDKCRRHFATVAVFYWMPLPSPPNQTP